MAVKLTIIDGKFRGREGSKVFSLGADTSFDLQSERLDIEGFQTVLEVRDPQIPLQNLELLERLIKEGTKEEFENLVAAISNEPTPEKQVEIASESKMLRGLSITADATGLATNLVQIALSPFVRQTISNLFD